MKKRIFAILLSFVLILLGLPIGVLVHGDTATTAMVAASARDTSNEEIYAIALKQLGLFRGVSDTDFDLDRAPTRVEALVMLIRSLGKEDQALDGTWNHPFDDVPAWANPYVGYAYENGLTNGVSATKFGNTDATAATYLTFVLRALGYSDENGKDFTWKDPFSLAGSVGILDDSVNVDDFWRADVATVSYLALDAKLKASESTLAHKLIEQGVFTREEYTAMILPVKSNPVIGNEDLIFTGKASIDDNNVVKVGGGIGNKAAVSGDFQSNHFTMSARIKVTDDSDTFSFIMGKDCRSFGYWVELTNSDGASYVNIYKDPVGKTLTAPSISNKLSFDLSCGEEYTLKMTFDTHVKENPRKEMVIEVFGEDGKYYSTSSTANAYGTPFYYSKSDSCYVYDFELSVSHYYDLDAANVVVFGHSFVEADSVGSANRSKAFAYLLENEIGEGTVLNFGLGGDSVNGMYSKISCSQKLIKNCEYALLCIGTNDRAMAADAFIAKLQQCIDKLEGMGITPILFTIPHAEYTMKSNMITINNWIKDSGYHYVDMYQVFANSDGTCKKDLFMGDKIHPLIAGHAEIFERIKTDCPFLFAD